MAKRTRISDLQRGILERFYQEGMIGTGTMYKEMVIKATTDTGLTKSQVEASNHFLNFIQLYTSFYLYHSANQVKLALFIDRRRNY